MSSTCARAAFFFSSRRRHTRWTGDEFRRVLFRSWLFGRASIHFKVWTRYRSMPLLLGLVLVSLFIWFTENIGTFTKTWLYPSQRLGWSMVGIERSEERRVGKEWRSGWVAVGVRKI